MVFIIHPNKLLNNFYGSLTLLFLTYYVYSVPKTFEYVLNKNERNPKLYLYIFIQTHKIEKKRKKEKHSYQCFWNVSNPNISILFRTKTSHLFPLLCFTCLVFTLQEKQYSRQNPIEKNARYRFVTFDWNPLFNVYGRFGMCYLVSCGRISWKFHSHEMSDFRWNVK